MSENGAKTAFLIRGGRVIDPGRSVDCVMDVVVGADGLIAACGDDVTGAVGSGAALGDVSVFDASGLIVCPGLIDMHIHLREPGGEHKETIETGTRAAAAGGFTSVACMPNTKPPLDNIETLTLVRERAAKYGYCRVYPLGTVTVGRSGREVVDMAALQACGAIAFSDDGDGVEDDAVMRAAFERAKAIDAVIIQHCEYKAISDGGVMHAGEVSKRLGLPGLDPRSEEAMIERDIQLVRETGAKYHVAHISTGKAIELVRGAKADGLPVTTEVCTHHLLMTDEACLERDPNTKMHPPLRSAEDVAACVAGLKDGTIDCIVTDHAPHSADEKGRGFVKAPPGIVGLETSLGLAGKLLCAGSADWPVADGWPELVRWMSCVPAQILGLGVGALAAGAPGDVTVIDPDCIGLVDPAGFASNSRNTPFSGWETRGRAVVTFVGGRLVFLADGAGDRFSGVVAPLVRV